MLFMSVKRKVKAVLPRSAINILSAIKYRLKAERLPDNSLYLDSIAGKKGIEIGGPSNVFRYILPIYVKAKSLDVVNFSHSTVWEGRIKEGKSFRFSGGKKGTQFIADATDLSQIEDNSYDFLLSSNCLEHIANPMKALCEWKRILKKDGVLILVLPNKKSNFDHKRPTTSFEHILDDYTHGTSENDLTHLDEILDLHDLSMDLAAGDFQHFKNRSLDNFNNRCLHHHVFDLDVMTRMVEHLGFECMKKDETFNDFFLLARTAGTISAA